MMTKELRKGKAQKTLTITVRINKEGGAGSPRSRAVVTWAKVRDFADLSTSEDLLVQ